MLQFFKDIIQMLAEFFQQETKPKNKPVHNRNERLLVFAAGEIGQKEIKGTKNNSRIEQYHAYASIKNNEPMADEIPWCASFICFCLEQVGMGSTNSRLARSFLKWGVSTKKDPAPGDLVVFWRGSKNGWQGHVGIYIGYSYSEKQIYVLGGNQSDAVNVTMYSTQKVLDYRRSSKMEKLTAEKRQRLIEIGSQIISGETVSLNPKVV